MSALVAVAHDRDELLETIRGLVDEGGVIASSDVAARYPGFFMDRIRARAIVRPKTTQEVAAVLSACNAAGQPVVLHGGMSGWVRATQTAENEIVLSLERLNKIIEIDKVNRTATVEAGVILQNFQSLVEDAGLFFPLDLGGRGSCQLGGNAATNAGGIRVLRYGMMRDQILGLEVVLPDGRVVSSLNRMIKNNTGYDLKQLFVGSEGTLGVITKLVLRLRELPTSTNTALVSANRFEQIADLMRFVDGRLGGTLSAFELVDRAFYDVNTRDGRHPPPLPPGKPFYAMIEALGSDQERDAALFEEVLAEASERGLLDDAVLGRSERERRAIWDIREDLEHIVREYQPFHAFDVSLPVGEMAAYMIDVTARLRAVAPDGQIAFLGHVGDNNLHVAIGAGGCGNVHAVEACVYEPLRPYAGSVSAEHGIGLEKKPWLTISRSETEIGLMRALKTLIDPNQILNPGKIFDPVSLAT